MFASLEQQLNLNHLNTTQMKKIKIATAKKQIKEGRFECMTDLKIGYVEIRRANGKREFIEVI